MAYSAEDKTRAIAIIKRHGGINAESRQEINITLGHNVTTSTLYSWTANSEISSGNRKSESARAKSTSKAAPAPASDEPAGELTPLQLRWFNEYLTCWNATEAAKRAGYAEDSAYQRGWENRHHPKIIAMITEQLSTLTMSAEEAMARLTVLASTSMQDLLDPTTGMVDLAKAVKNGSIQAIKEYEVIETELGTRHKIKLYDKQAALQTIWKNQRTIAGQPTEVIAMMPLLQEIFELLNELGRDPAALFDKMLQRLHTERSKLKNTGSAAG